jgi:hypothetical protein
VATTLDLAVARVRADDDLGAWPPRLEQLAEGSAEVHALVKGGVDAVPLARRVMDLLGQEAPAAPVQLGLALG